MRSQIDSGRRPLLLDDDDDDDSNLTPPVGPLLSVGRRDVRRAATRPPGRRRACFPPALGLRDATFGTAATSDRRGRSSCGTGNRQPAGGQHRFPDR